jgi:hypothetical protein
MLLLHLGLREHSHVHPPIAIVVRPESVRRGPGQCGADQFSAAQPSRTSMLVLGRRSCHRSHDRCEHLGYARPRQLLARGSDRCRRTDWRHQCWTRRGAAPPAERRAHGPTGALRGVRRDHLTTLWTTATMHRSRAAPSHWVCAARSRSTSTRRKILPVGDFGIASTNSMSRTFL